MYLCVGMCMYTQRPKDVIGCHRTRVRGLCELLYVGNENQTQVLCKSSSALNS